MSDLRIEEYDERHADAALTVINEAFGSPRPAGWFDWKHREGPWGPSRGVVAYDDEGMVGIRLLLPWRFRRCGGEVLAYRAVEASTVPRARGKGVFSQLNRRLMDQLQDEPDWTFLYSTPNQLSRTGYLKLGWTWLDPIPHEYRLSPVRRAAGELLVDEEALATFQPAPSGDGITTAWTADALRWRLDPRTGNEYRSIAIPGPRGFDGLAYRVLLSRKVPMLLPIAAWGDTANRARLLAHAAWDARAPVVLDVAGDVRRRSTGLRRGESLLTVWPCDDAPDGWGDLDRTSSWELCFAELESVL